MFGWLRAISSGGAGDAGQNPPDVHACAHGSATIHRREGRLEEAAFSAALASRFAGSKIPFVDSVLWAVQDEQVGINDFLRDMFPA